MHRFQRRYPHISGNCSSFQRTTQRSFRILFRCRLSGPKKLHGIISASHCLYRNGKAEISPPWYRENCRIEPGICFGKPFIKACIFQAHKQKANIHLKLGNLKEAKASLLILVWILWFIFTITKKSDDSALQETLNQIEEMQSSIEKAKKLYADGKYSEVIHLLDFAMATVTSNSELHEMRGNCYLRTGEQIKGIEELRQSVHMVTDNREGMLRVSILMYEAGLVARSLEEVRRCIQLDQDDSNCRQHYKKVKVLADAQTNSESEKWAKCLSLAQKFLEVEDNNAEPILQAKIIICHCGSRVRLVLKIPDASFNFNVNALL